MEGFLITFITIAIAELFDKSQLAILLLASQTKKHLQLFCGVFLAFALLTGAAVIFGGILTEFIPETYLKILSGILFIFFGIRTLLSKEDSKEKTRQGKSALLSGFLLILLSELGDKTQLSTILFATRFSPLLVFLAALSALSLLALLAIQLGGVIKRFGKKSLLTKIAGILFIILGAIFLFV